MPYIQYSTGFRWRGGAWAPPPTSQIHYIYLNLYNVNPVLAYSCIHQTSFYNTEILDYVNHRRFWELLHSIPRCIGATVLWKAYFLSQFISVDNTIIGWIIEEFPHQGWITCDLLNSLFIEAKLGRFSYWDRIHFARPLDLGNNEQMSLKLVLYCIIWQNNLIFYNLGGFVVVLNVTHRSKRNIIYQVRYGSCWVHVNVVCYKIDLWIYEAYL